MHASAAKSAYCKREISYQDYLAREWIYRCAPCRWQHNVEVRFRRVPYSALEPAGSRKRPEVLAKWLAKLQRREPLPPPVVCSTGTGTYYIRDGNHRHEAIALFLGAKTKDASIRVAEAVPKPGFHFRYRWFGTYGSFQLEPSQLNSAKVSSRLAVPALAQAVRLAPLLGRTMVLVAHPDDETACATLLQRVREPAVVVMTDGAPVADFFWRAYGSRANYAIVRRAEAIRALAAVGLAPPHFLGDQPGHRIFRDQELYRQLGAAVPAVLQSVESIRPEALLVPAYEGGHPDHDVCSFLGHIVGIASGVPVWEMPLYHRSPSGRLVHQQFVASDNTEVILEPGPDELRRRRAMVAAYASQHDLEIFLAARREIYRPQPAYDYSRPPHPWKLNYEAWQWPMGGADLCRAFVRCLQSQAATILPGGDTPLSMPLLRSAGRRNGPRADAGDQRALGLETFPACDPSEAKHDSSRVAEEVLRPAGAAG